MNFTPRFECELPQDVRRELGEPKRARILRPPEPLQKPSWLNVARLGLCALAFIMACAAVVSWFANKHESRPIPAPAIVQPTPATVQPAPSVQSQPTIQVAPIQPAPRTRLVRLPSAPPRARLVRLPDFTEITAAHIDETHVITMPYGTEVRATLRGFLGTENQRV